MAKLRPCFPRGRKKKKGLKRQTGDMKQAQLTWLPRLQDKERPLCLPWGPRGGPLPGVGEQMAMQGEIQPQRGWGFSRSPGPSSIVSPHLLSEPPTAAVPNPHAQRGKAGNSTHLQSQRSQF